MFEEKCKKVSFAELGAELELQAVNIWQQHSSGDWEGHPAFGQSGLFSIIQEILELPYKAQFYFEIL